MSRKLGKRKIIIVLIVVVALAVGVILSVFFGARAFEGNGIAAFDTKDTTKELGTKENPYTILEIVPDINSATVGYLIKEQEPNDGGLEAISATDKTVEGSAANEYAKAFDAENSTNPASKVGDYTFTYVFENDYDNIDVEKYKEDVYNGMGAENHDAYSQYGYFERVADGEGRYEYNGSAFVPSQHGNYNWTCVGEFVYDPGREKGSVRCTREMSYVETTKDIITGQDITVEMERTYSTEAVGKYAYMYYFTSIGDFAWVPNDNYNNENVFRENVTDEEIKSSTEIGSKLYMTRTEQKYYWYYSSTIVCNDLLRKGLVGDKAFDYVTQVVTVTPDQLDVDYKAKDKAGNDFYPADYLIKNADMIMIHDSAAGYNIAKAINPNLKGKEDDAAPRFGSSKAMPKKAMQALIYRGSGPSPAAIVFDEDAITTADDNMKLLYDVYNNLGAKLGYNWKQNGNASYDSQDYGAKIEAAIAESQDTPEKKGSYYRNFTYKENDALGRSQYVYNYLGTDDSWLTTAFGDDKITRNEELNATAFDNVGLTDTGAKMSVATMLKAINLETDGINQPKKLRILELQPNEKFYATDRDSWVKYYLDLMPWYIGTTKDIADDVTIDHMATYQFIGRNEDPNETYDLVLIGCKEQDETNGVIDKKNSDYYGSPIRDSWFYNDTGMGQIAYSSVGDWVSTALDKEGKQKTTIRYSGNDITKKKYDQLLNFAKKAPVIVADDLYDSDGTVLGSKIDVSSFVYRLAGKNKDQDLFVDRYIDGVDSSIEANSVRKALKTGNISLSFENGIKPVEYKNTYETSDNDGVDELFYTTMNSNADDPRQRDSHGNNALVFEFEVEGNSFYDSYDAEIPGYGIDLYLDSNGNGIFEGSITHRNEYKDNNRSIEGKLTEISSNLEILDESTGVYVSNNQLTNGHKYKVTKTLPNSEVGMIPWKLELYELTDKDNDYAIRYSETGCTRIKSDKSKKRKIRVLQMNLTADMSDVAPYVCFDSDYRAGLDGWAYRNREKIFGVATNANRIADSFNNFVDVMGDQGDFIFVNPDPVKNVNTGSKVKYLTNSQWLQKYNDKKKWADYLMNNYDMLIIGMKDKAVFTNNENFLYGFEVFRSAGKPIIMTHDVVEAEDSDSSISDDVRYYTRDISGQMRKYYNMAVIDEPSLLDNPYNPNAYEYSYDNYWMTGYSRPYSGNKYGTSFTSDVISKYYDSHFHGKANKQMDNSVRSMLFYNRDRTKDAVSGRHWSVWDWDYVDDYTTYYVDRIDRGIPGISTNLYTNRNGLGWFDSGDPKTTNKIMPVNEGQITKYPFDIGTESDGKITVRNTHAQNFQLDLEFDEEGDVLVWYDLVGGTGKDLDVYGGRHLDSRNNYYIYTKGNITYSGVGHSKGGVWSEKGLDQNEIALFINTMIAAYRSDASVPYITVTHPEAVNNGDNTSIYVDKDAHNVSDKISVPFRIDDDTTNTQINRQYALRVTKYVNDVLVPLDNGFVYPAYKYPKQYDLSDFDPNLNYAEMDNGNIYYKIELLYNDSKFEKYGESMEEVNNMFADERIVRIQDLPLFSIK